MKITSALIHSTLQQIYGYSSFRPGQEAIITSILNQRDTLAVLPTGGGKSICYQIPALLFPGLSIIVSPLISLMNDQTDTLRKHGVACACLHSAMPREEQAKIYSDLSGGTVRILYLSPERLTSNQFRSFLNDSHLEVSFLCIDEAHCITQWGIEFRPSYRHMIHFITEQTSRPVIAAFTATASDDVRNDIITSLKLCHPAVFVMGFDRLNLYYEVRHVTDKYKALLALLHRYQGQCGIVYCLTRKETEQLCKALSLSGIHALPYHGGMDAALRSENQNRWLSDEMSLIVATNAFGMGIDKPNVRFVIHYSMSKNIEDYYQEAGRAGRDGLPADCILLVNKKDIRIHQHFLQQIQSAEVRNDERNKLYAMMEYAGAARCLRSILLNYFGEHSSEFCGHCSVCLQKGPFSDSTVKDDQEDVGLYQELRALRASLAGERMIPAEKIMSDAALHELSIRRPTTRMDLLFMEQVPFSAAIKYGANFLSEIRAWKNARFS